MSPEVWIAGSLRSGRTASMPGRATGMCLFFGGEFQKLDKGAQSEWMDWSQALLGAQRADVGAIRAIWAIQGRIALNADEEKAVGVAARNGGGPGARAMWNPALSIRAKEFEFTDPEVARIKAASQMWNVCERRPALA